MHLVLAGSGRAELFRAALPALREAVVSKDKNLRARAVDALRWMGADGVRCLLAALANPEPLDRRTAQFIADYPDVALPVLQQAVRARDPARRNALELLKCIAPQGKELVPLLLPLVDDNDPAIRASAAFVLGLYGSAARPAVPKLMRLIATDYRAPQAAADEAIARIGLEADQIDVLWLAVDGTQKNSQSHYRACSGRWPPRPCHICSERHPALTGRCTPKGRCRRWATSDQPLRRQPTGWWRFSSESISTSREPDRCNSSRTLHGHCRRSVPLHFRRSTRVWRAATPWCKLVARTHWDTWIPWRHKGRRLAC
jgi:hypothetical protein